ncbi:MAG: ATP-grasp domain-containing protein [Moorellales bacterium]
MRDFETYLRLRQESSMLYWWPRVRDLGVPMPETEVLEFGFRSLACLVYPEGEQDVEEAGRVLEVVREAARGFGYPVFIRTDQASGKHEWENSCFVASEEDLPRCLGGVIEFNEMADLEPRAIVIRRYIPLESAFTAFRGMPVARERRYFVLDGRVVCHHPYWPEDAVRFLPGRQPQGWREKLAALNEETLDEIELLNDYAVRLAAALPGYWSLDFARGAGGVWYFIDAARGELSWHPECPHRWGSDG